MLEDPVGARAEHPLHGYFLDRVQVLLQDGVVGDAGRRGRTGVPVGQALLVGQVEVDVHTGQVHVGVLLGLDQPVQLHVFVDQLVLPGVPVVLRVELDGILDFLPEQLANPLELLLAADEAEINIMVMGDDLPIAEGPQKCAVVDPVGHSRFLKGIVGEVDHLEIEILVFILQLNHLMLVGMAYCLVEIQVIGWILGRGGLKRRLW